MAHYRKRKELVKRTSGIPLGNKSDKENTKLPAIVISRQLKAGLTRVAKSKGLTLAQVRRKAYEQLVSLAIHF
jgi:hypothetical protein